MQARRQVRKPRVESATALRHRRVRALRRSYGRSWRASRSRSRLAALLHSVLEGVMVLFAAIDNGGVWCFL